MKELYLEEIESPIGKILVITENKTLNQTLCGLEFADYEARTMRFLEKRFGEFRLNSIPNHSEITQRIQAYLEGNYSSVDSIPVNTGGTAFQQQVWTALRSIPVSSVITYGELAQRLDKPGAARAVGITNSLNPISIVLPCHRVIGANGMLTGYAGGLERKRWLLNHEGVKLPAQQLSLLADELAELPNLPVSPIEPPTELPSPIATSAPA